jgi:hypothetical protein
MTLAFPYFPECDHGIQPYPGLTKREYAAIKIMAGFAADPGTEFQTYSNEERAEFIKAFAICAIEWADALFNELDKTEE